MIMNDENKNKNTKSNDEEQPKPQKDLNPKAEKETKSNPEKTEEKKPVPKQEKAKPKPKARKKPKRRKRLNIFKKKSDSAESIATLYKETEDLFEQQAEVEKDVKDEEKILAHIMDKRKKRRKRALIILAFVLLVIIAGASVFGFIIFNRKKQFAEDKIKIEVIGPDKTQIGDEITYLINYKNEGQIDLKDVKLHIRAPRGLKIIEKNPDTESTTWYFNKLNIDDTGQIKLKGQLIDDAINEQKLTATITYTPENFSSEFSKSTSFSTELLALELFTTIDKPDAAVPGQKLNITINYKNSTEQDYEQLILKLFTPSDFEVLSSQPEGENEEWAIENIEANSEEESITIEGKFKEDLDLDEVTRDQTFTLQILYPGELGAKYVQSENEFIINLSDQKVLTYLIINGKSENSNTEFGEELNCTAVFKNSSEESLDNITAKVLIEQEPVEVLDWQESEIAGGTLSSTETGREIYWQISSLEPDSEKVFDFTIPIKKLTALQDFSNESLAEQIIKLYSQLIISEDEADINSSTIEIGLNTDLALGVKALYYDQDENPIGSGPLPPRANQQTNYKIFWDVSNSIHEISDIEIKATLSDKVKWIGQEETTTGDIIYNSDTNQVIWKINRLPISAESAHANFEIALSPEDEDIGTLMKLTENTSLEAKDTKTNDTIIISLNPISSNLEADEFGKEQGVIEE